MRLRRLQTKDVERILLWMHDKKTKDIFIKDFSKYTKDDVLEFINNQNDSSDIHYACVNDDDFYLGTISLKNVDLCNQNAELAISFIQEAHGTGASQFAMIEILKIAFTKLQLKKVYLNVLATNLRAIRFYKKNGFQEEGHFKMHVKKNNSYCDLLWFAIYEVKE